MGGRVARFLSSPATLAASAILFLLFVSIVLPAESAKAAAYTPAGAEFDTSFFYTPAGALERAASYSVEGRLAYIAARWGFDLAWPAAYGLFCLSAWAFALARLGPRARPAWLAVPALAPALDLAENVSVTMLMALGPARRSGWAVAASAATALKWLFVLAAMGGAVALPALAGLRAALARARRR